MAEISLREYYEQIEGMIDQGRYAQAVAHGKHVLGTYPKCVGGYRLLGRAMLEARQDDSALDMFLRVLSADPEDMLAWVAMSEVYDRRDELEAAVWCLERAFELSVDNQLLGEELRQLYGRRDGVQPERVELTRGALARLYLKGDLLSRAVSEFRALLGEQPDRADLEIAFAEALWRNEQRLEASEVCQKILDKLPYCLKANLILGEIWVNSGREEGQTYLRRAEALDPQNTMAQALFGATSPLQARDVPITSLEYRPPTEEERPAWMAGVELVSAGEPPLSEREAALVDIAAALEAQIEIPSWLEEIDVGEAPEALEMPEFMASMEEPSAAEEPALPQEQVPEWLAGVGEGLEVAAETWGVGQIPEAELTVEEEKVGEVPDWLAGLSAESIPGQGEASDEGAVPDFLAEVSAGRFAEEAPSSEEVPDWLAGLREQAAEGVQESVPVEPAPAEIPAWIQEMAPPEAAAPRAGEPALGAEEAAPPWLAGEGMPSGEEALAWLEQLTEGKEEELQAQVEAEIEARTAEIMGRPKAEAPAFEAPAPFAEAPPQPTPAEIPAWMQELAPSEAKGPAPSEEAFGWTAFGEPGAFAPGGVEGPAPSKVEGPVPPEAVAPPIGEPVPSVTEEAFGWTAFGEPAAFAPGGVEGPALSEVEEPVPPEAVAPPVGEPVPSVSEEAFGWTAFGEPAAFAPGGVEGPAPSEVEGPVPGVAEEVVAAAVAAPLVEELVPGEVEEIVAPPVGEVEAPPAADISVEKVPAPVARPAVVAEPVRRVTPPVTAAPPPKPKPVKPPVVEPFDPFAAEKAYLKEHPRDYDTILNLARAQWQADRRSEALMTYSRLIRAGKLLDVVIAELEEYLEKWPDISTQRVLGDAYMKNDQVDKALHIYRQALEHL